MGIASELQQMAANKAAIKAAIEAKNPDVPPTDDMGKWADAIASIPEGGGGASLDALTKVEYANGLVAYYAFSGAVVGRSDVPNLANAVRIEFGTDVTSIDEFQYSHAPVLDEVVVHGNRSQRTFLGNNYLGVSFDRTIITEVVVDEYVDIGAGTFRNMTSLQRVTFSGRTVAQVKAMTNYSFYLGGYSSGTPSSAGIEIVCEDGSFTLPFWLDACFLPGTKILMADGTEKNVEDVRYGDVLTVWDFDNGRIGSAPVCWLTRDGLMNDHYYQLTFSDGTVLKTTGRNSNHKVYNVDKRKFEGVDKTEVGDRIYSVGGIVTVTDKRYVEDEVNYYNLMTSRNINCFANGILTSDRYGNMYPITEGMTYDKTGRTVRPYSVYEAVGIERYWYDNLRLGEVDETVEETVKYIRKNTAIMRPLPEGER